MASPLPNTSAAAGINAAHCRFFVRELRARQLDADALLAHFDLTAAEVDGLSVVIPVGRFLALLERCETWTGDPAFGLRAGERARLSDVDILGLWPARTPTGKEGRWADSASRFSAAWPGALDVRFLLSRGRVLVRHAPPRAPKSHRLWVDYFAARTLKLGKLLVDGVSPLEVRFGGPAPADTRPYAALFGCPVFFGAPHDELVYDASLLGRSAPFAEGGAIRVLSAHLERLRPGGSRLGPDLVDVVRDTAAAALGTGTLSLPTVAARLDRSERTLRRQLRDLGTSYQAVVDELRRELAIEELHRGRPVDELAERLGFSEASTFYRAFKRWTGKTVGAYRRSATRAK